MPPSGKSWICYSFIPNKCPATFGIGSATHDPTLNLATLCCWGGGGGRQKTHAHPLGPIVFIFVFFYRLNCKSHVPPFFWVGPTSLRNSGPATDNYVKILGILVDLWCHNYSTSSLSIGNPTKWFSHIHFIHRGEKTET